MNCSICNESADRYISPLDEGLIFCSIPCLKLLTEKLRRKEAMKLKIQKVEEKWASKVEAIGYKLVSYKSSSEPMQLQCDKNHSFELYPSHWRATVRRKHIVCLECREDAQRDLKFQHYYKVLASRKYILDKQLITAKTQMVSFSCDKGHKSESILQNLLNGSTCTSCLPNKKKSSAEVLRLYLKEGYLLHDPYTNSKTRMSTTCPNGHVYMSDYDSFSKGARCPHGICGFTSRQEDEVACFIEEFFEIKRNDRDTIRPHGIDVLIPSKGIGIEYCGLRWHNEALKDRQYHKMKLEKALAANLRLITIFEDEWLSRQEQVKNYLQAVLNLGEKIFARKCDIRVVQKSEAKVFLYDYHIQSHGKFNDAIGLYYKDELVQLMAFGPHHRDNNLYTLTRMCTKKGYQVVGGASRLFQHAQEIFKFDRVVTYADRRWSEGDVYLKLGFRKALVSDPDYSYMKNNIQTERFSKQSKRKTQAEKLLDKSEREIRNEQGFFRIWDCGKIRFEWVKE